jgi:hypothetical protein
MSGVFAGAVVMAAAPVVAHAPAIPIIDSPVHLFDPRRLRDWAN